MSFDVIGAYSDGTSCTIVYNQSLAGSTGADDSTNYAFDNSFSVSGTGTISGKTVSFSCSGGVYDGTVYTATVSNVLSSTSESLTQTHASFSLPVDDESEPLPPAIDEYNEDGVSIFEIEAPPIIEYYQDGVEVSEFPVPGGGGGVTYRMRGYLTPSGPYVQWDEPTAPGTNNAPGPVTDVVILRKTGC